MLHRALNYYVAFSVLFFFCAGASAQTRYPTERNQSPITRQVADRLQDIVVSGLSQGKRDNRFIKVGDSITVYPSYFMGQYTFEDYDPAVHGTGDETRDLDNYEYLRDSLDHFLSGTIPAGNATSFDRESLAAQVGQTASWAVTGNPSPLDQEIAAVSPLFAVIMFGTNDIGWWSDDHLVMSWIIENLAQNVDECIAEGTVPILKAPPLRVGYELKMLTLSHLIRALAQDRQIPFINYHRAMMPLPDHGLGSDGVHPNRYQWNWTCHLTPEGLQYGTNQHNLVAMQAFDRALRATVMGAPALDFEPQELLGAGSQGTPYQVDDIPFIDARTTSAGALDVDYALTLAQSRQLRFMVTYQGSTDVDVTVLDSNLSVLHTDDGLIDVTLDAGQYVMRIETRDGQSANIGGYQALIMDRTSTGMPASHGIFIDGVRVEPDQIDPGQTTDVTFSVTALDDGTINSVFLDLSELGGSSSVAMTNEGDGRYSHTASVNVPGEGEKVVAVTAEDNDSNLSAVPAYFMVGTPPATLTINNVAVAGGSGTVSSAPPGIDCGTDCTEDYANGTSVVLTALIEGGSVFAGWGGACTGTGTTCDVTMTQNQLVTATFEPVGHTYTLAVSKTGTGAGTVSSTPSGIDCGSDCEEEFLSGSQVTLSATAGYDSTFAGWSGACSGVGPCTVTMNTAQTVTAAFRSNMTPAVIIYDDALGSGWQNWSWTATIDLAGTSPVHSGSYAVNATLGQWGGFSPAMGSGSIDTTFGYEAVSFWVHGGTDSDKPLTFFTQTVASGGQDSTEVGFTAVADTWTEITITLDELGNPPSIGRLNFFNGTGAAMDMVTFDEIRLEPSPSTLLFADGFESGGTTMWSSTDLH